MKRVLRVETLSSCLGSSLCCWFQLTSRFKSALAFLSRSSPTISVWPFWEDRRSGWFSSCKPIKINISPQSFIKNWASNLATAHALVYKNLAWLSSKDTIAAESGSALKSRSNFTADVWPFCDAIPSGVHLSDVLPRMQSQFREPKMSSSNYQGSNWWNEYVHFPEQKFEILLNRKY